MRLLRETKTSHLKTCICGDAGPLLRKGRAWGMLSGRWPLGAGTSLTSVHLIIIPHNLFIHCIYFEYITYNIKKFKYMYSLAFTVFIANECLQHRTRTGSLHCFCFA